MTDITLESISRQLDRVLIRLDAIEAQIHPNGRRVLRAKRYQDPNFPKELRGLLDAHNMTQSDLAAKIWSRKITKDGKNAAIGKDRISNWVNGLEYPSKANLQKVLDVFGLV